MKRKRPVMPENKSFFTVQDLAQLYEVTRQTADQWIRKGLLPEPHRLHEGKRAPRIWTPKTMREIIDTFEPPTAGRMTSKRYLAAYTPEAEALLKEAAAQEWNPDLAKRAQAVIWAIGEGMNRDDVADRCGVSKQTIHSWLRNWYEEGISGIS